MATNKDLENSPTTTLIKTKMDTNYDLISDNSKSQINFISNLFNEEESSSLMFMDDDFGQFDTENGLFEDIFIDNNLNAMCEEPLFIIDQLSLANGLDIPIMTNTVSNETKFSEQGQQPFFTAQSIHTQNELTISNKESVQSVKINELEMK